MILFPECVKDARGDVSRSQRLQSHNCWIHVQADKEIQQVHLHLLHSQVESLQKDLLIYFLTAAYVLSRLGDPF